MSNSAISFNTAGLASTTSPGLVGTGAQTFAGAKTFNNGLEFTTASLSDVQATRLGLKQYLHGTTYNGGIAPTITLNSGGGTLSSVTRSSFIPYQFQDNTWRLRFSFVVVLSSTTRTNAVVAVNGITTKNTANYYQGISAAALFSAVNTTYCNTEINNNLLYANHSSGTTSTYAYFGDIELESKPTWAY